MAIELPAEWQQLHWKTQVNLAQDILSDMPSLTPSQQATLSLGDKMEASTARAIIATEAKRQMSDTRKPAAIDPVVPESTATIPLRLFRDTWQDEIRIRADGRVTQWSLDDAKRLLAIDGLAERADPLPGE
jgi:hypothetical protein